MAGAFPAGIGTAWLVIDPLPRQASMRQARIENNESGSFYIDAYQARFCFCVTVLRSTFHRLSAMNVFAPNKRDEPVHSFVFDLIDPSNAREF
jgi:hypothetical protein